MAPPTVVVVGQQHCINLGQPRVIYRKRGRHHPLRPHPLHWAAQRRRQRRGGRTQLGAGAAGKARRTWPAAPPAHPRQASMAAPHLQRSLKIGSVRNVSPSSCTSIVEWPTHVAWTASAAGSRGGGGMPKRQPGWHAGCPQLPRQVPSCNRSATPGGLARAAKSTCSKGNAAAKSAAVGLWLPMSHPSVGTPALHSRAQGCMPNATSVQSSSRCCLAAGVGGLSCSLPSPWQGSLAPLAVPLEHIRERALLPGGPRVVEAAMLPRHC